MAGRQEWQLEKEALEQEHWDKYGWLSDDLFDDGGPSWETIIEERSSWDYPDPVFRRF